MNWKSWWLAALVLVAAACGGNAKVEPETKAAFDPSTLPDVVARIDSQEITREQLVRRAENDQRDETGRPLDVDYYREVLDQMISSELLYQESLARGFSISEDELNTRISAIRDRFPSAEDFEKALVKQGLTPAEMSSALAKDISVSRYLREVVISKVSVTEEEARAYFDDHRDSIRGEDQLRVRHILLRVAEGAPEAAVERTRSKLEGIRAEILAGGDFAELARKYSQDPGSAPLGGDLDWISRGATVPAFDRAAFSLEVGELSPVIQSGFGLHILQVLERRPGPEVSYEESKVQLLDFLRERKVAEQIGTHAEALRKKAKVEIYL